MIPYGGLARKPRHPVLDRTDSPLVRGDAARVAGHAVLGDSTRRMRGFVARRCQCRTKPGGGFYGAPNIDIGRINP